MNVNIDTPPVNVDVDTPPVVLNLTIQNPNNKTIKKTGVARRNDDGTLSIEMVEIEDGES